MPAITFTSLYNAKRWIPKLILKARTVSFNTLKLLSIVFNAF